MLLYPEKFKTYLSNHEVAAAGKYHIDLWHVLWHYSSMKSERKITIHIPAELLKKAQEATQTGITETIRQGLQLVAASRAYEKLLGMEGKVKFSVSVKSLRDDRK